MARKLSLRKNVLYATIMTVAVFTLLNIVIIPFAHQDSVFWDNPLMVMYPVDSFDSDVAREKSNYNKDPERAVRYVPDEHRWYRLEPGPVIPEEGNLILHFGDSSTWGWGLSESVRARRSYPGALQELLPENIHSVNLGVPGYSSLQGLRYAEELVPQHHSRIAAITLYFGNNDATENGSTDSKKLQSTRSFVIKGLMKLPLCRVMNNGLSRLRVSDNQEPRVNPSEYGENLQEMIVLASRYDIPVVLVMPSVPLSWKPAHLNPAVSLEDKVRNSWTKSELALAKSKYEEGIRLVGQQADGYEPLLREALEHDWVLPRIKKAWRDELERIATEDNVSLVVLPQPFIEAESLNRFEDYCHPSPEAHAEIAEGIAQALGYQK